MSRAATLFLVFIAAGWAIFPLRAEAQQKKAEDGAAKEAKERFAKGVEFYNDGEYSAALAEFHWAYEVSPHYMVLFNIGRCYAKLGKHLKAIGYFEQYLEEGGENVPQGKKEEVLKELEALKMIIAMLDVSVNVKGASIGIDGKEEGISPLAEKIKVEPGPHTVSVAADGYKPQSKEIIVASGKLVEVKFELEEIVKWAVLKIACDIPGAVGMVDGKEVGRTPWSGKIKAGKHSVEVKAKGYKREVKEVFLEADEERMLTFNPQIAGKASRLVVKANVEGAEVFVEGKKVGVVPMKALDLPAGVVRIKVMAKGYIAWEGDLELAEGKPLTATVKLKRDKKRISQVYFWTALSVGIAAAISAGTTGILSLGKQDDYDRYVKGFEDGSIANNSVNRKKFDDVAAEGRKLVLATDAMWVVAGSFAAAACVLAFFTAFRPPESRVQLGLGPAFQGTGSMLSVTGGF